MNYPGPELLGKTFNSSYERMQNLPWCAYVLYKTLNLVISVVFAEDGKEMHQNVYLTCRAMDLGINSHYLETLVLPLPLPSHRCTLQLLY